MSSFPYTFIATLADPTPRLVLTSEIDVCKKCTNIESQEDFSQLGEKLTLAFVKAVQNAKKLDT